MPRHTSRHKKRSPRFLLPLLVLVVACLAVAAYKTATIGNPGLPSAEESEQISKNDALMTVVTRAGTPSNLIHYTGMDVNFNPEKHIPNWVSWELTSAETTGGTPRPNKFHAEEEVRGSAEPYDYSYSGYDRGHMAPAGDMKWNPTAMYESFAMTNICPQAKELNTGAWRTLEEKCRTWAVADGRIIIICGPVIDDKPVEYIGETRVYVPTKFFKVILAPDARPARAIAFLMPNGHVEGGMQQAVVSVDSVESLTGHNFFSSLPDEIEDKIEARSDFLAWPRTRVKNE